MTNQDDAIAAGQPDDEQFAAVVAAVAAESKGATDIIVLDVSTTLGVCDYFVLVTVSSAPMSKAVSDEIELRLQQTTRLKRRSTEGADARRWVLLDYGDIVVHIFATEDREFYRIERLFADAPTFDWEASRRAAGL